MQQLFLETSNGLMALLVEKSPKYAGFWISSLCHSANKGLPDNELTPLKERVDLVEEIRRLTTQPTIFDDAWQNILISIDQQKTGSIVSLKEVIIEYSTEILTSQIREIGPERT